MLVSDGYGVVFISETIHNRMSRPRMDPDRPPYQVFRIVFPTCLKNIGISVRANQFLSDLEYNFLTHLLYFPNWSLRKALNFATQPSLLIS